MGYLTYWITTFALVLVFFAAVGYAKTTNSKHRSTSTAHKTSAHSSKHSKSKYAGQRNIDEQRAREIQTALIREHYLSGEPTGSWDQQTRDALVRFQQANGWQTKVLPDSRALIKLGLGPDHTGLLNPDTAYISSPHELGADHETQPGGSAQQ